MNGITYEQFTEDFNTSIEEYNLLLVMELNKITNPGWSNLIDTKQLIEKSLVRTVTISGDRNKEINGTFELTGDIHGYEQSIPTQQQPKSPEVVGTGLSGGPDNHEFQLGQYFASPCGSYKTTGLFEELSKLTQTLSDAESSPARAYELLHSGVGKRWYSSSDKKAFKCKNRGNRYAFKKSGHY
jgi:hypothetical protein